ncbi:MAG: hypothetical protein RJB25_388 [Bacteroidota bacterium]
MIELKGIQLTYQKPVLKSLNLQVKRGEILGLVGKSGAGKSSLLKICAGLQDPDQGQIVIDGQTQTISNSIPTTPSKKTSENPFCIGLMTNAINASKNSCEFSDSKTSALQKRT